MTYAIAREAARIRAATDLRTPTPSSWRHLLVGSPIVVASDDRWLPAVERAGLAVGLCHLDAFSDGA